ncbi:hypothetical protein EDC04DRAFT_3096018 [Pisolithus marmoratus]|nr:hypothetical protein EDC04DRAFT_3096018 [Pisolithus marmoratus]
MEPELAEDGCNWHTYGSWVLKAISEDGLMGHIDGSETRPTTPKLLQEYGAGRTPRTNEERDVIAAWKTADDAWHQRAAMAHQYIIFGLPDSILMLCMHLDTPGEAFAYLENRYGPIPRPKSQKVVDEAVQEHDMPSEQCTTAENAQSTCNSDHEPEIPPSGEGCFPDSPNDCAETETGSLTPEDEVIDVQQVDSCSPVTAIGKEDPEQPSECANALDAADEASQHTDDELVESRDLPESSSKAFDSVGNAVGQAGVQLQMPCEDNQFLSTDDETVANVPDPPGTYAKLPIPDVEHSTLQYQPPTRTHSATSTKLILRVSGPAPKEPDKVKGGHGHDDAAGSGHPDSHGVRKSMLTDSGGQHTECKAKRPNRSPAPPTPLPNRTRHVPRPYRVPRRRGRLKTSVEIVSNARTRRNAYHNRAVPMWLLPPPSTSSKWSIYLAGGLRTMSVCYSKIRSSRRGETRGDTYRIASIAMPLLQTLSSPSKQLWNIANTYWRQGVPPISTWNDANRPRDLRMAKRLPRNSGRRRDDMRTSVYHNDLPDTSPNDFAHPPGTLGDPRRRGRIKTNAENVSRFETRGSKASILIIPIPPPRELARPLCNVASTYWRHGIPPWTDVNHQQTFYIRNGGLAIMVQGQRTRAHQTDSETGSCHNAAWQTQPNNARTPHGLEAALAADILIFIQMFGILFPSSSISFTPT